MASLAPKGGAWVPWAGKTRILNTIKINVLYVSDYIGYFISIWFSWFFIAKTNQAAEAAWWGNAGEGLALIAEEVLAGSRCVVNFILASEQGSQVFVDVVHISPRGVLWPSSLSILATLWSRSTFISYENVSFHMVAFSWLRLASSCDRSGRGVAIASGCADENIKHQ